MIGVLRVLVRDGFGLGATWFDSLCVVYIHCNNIFFSCLLCVIITFGWYGVVV